MWHEERTSRTSSQILRGPARDVVRKRPHKSRAVYDHVGQRTAWSRLNCNNLFQMHPVLDAHNRINNAVKAIG